MLAAAPVAHELHHREPRRLGAALALVDVKVLDHFVIGSGAAMSFAERGLL